MSTYVVVLAVLWYLKAFTKNDSLPELYFKSHLGRGDVAATLAKVAATQMRPELLRFATSRRRRHGDIVATSLQ